MSPLVVNGRIQGFAWEPGRNANWRAGRSMRWGAACHQTAGRCAGDRSILTNLGGAYVPRDPGCGPGATQFSELDAVAFTQCEWNDELMPCEVEWVPGQDFTGYQIEKCGLFVAACIEFGVPDVRLDPPNRVPVGTRIGGFIDHRKLVHRACDEHSDGWYAHWPAIRAAAAHYLGETPPVPIIVPKEIDMASIATFTYKDENDKPRLQQIGVDADGNLIDIGTIATPKPGQPGNWQRAVISGPGATGPKQTREPAKPFLDPGMERDFADLKGRLDFSVWAADGRRMIHAVLVPGGNWESEITP